MLAAKRNIQGYETGHGNPVFIREGRFHVKNMISQEELTEAYRLRHRIFVQELHWVPRQGDALETDDYDDNAVSFGVFDERGRLSAYLRLIMPGRPFMLEREFSSLLDKGHRVRRQGDTSEISRLCVAPESRSDKISGNFGIHTPSMLLFKGVYAWCNKNGIRFLYAVAEDKVYRLFRAKGFPYRLVGGPVAMPDGVKAVAVMMDWREFEEMNRGKRPWMLKWFIRDKSSHAPLRLPQPGPCSPRPVSA